MDDEIIIAGKPYSIRKGAARVLSLRRELIDEVLDPKAEIQEIAQSKVRADLVTFVDRPLCPSPPLPYFQDWDNRAILEITSYDHWLMKQIPQQTRNKVRKAEKKGVVVHVEPFNDKLIADLVGMFNESPFRQGRPNRYYGWDDEMVRRVWKTDLDRSVWIVAYYDGEMIGFIKLILGNGIARTSGTIAKMAHRDRAPMNAILAKSIEVCAERGISHLVYGQFIYGRKGEDSLTIFKVNNGFKRFDIPRWYIPLSLWGHTALRLGLYKELIELVPTPLLKMIRTVKNKWYQGAMPRLVTDGRQ
ncbi:MAG: GNAT family N-acetyltransferase [Nitrospira sp.]